MPIKNIQIKLKPFALQELVNACSNGGQVYYLSKESRALGSFVLVLYVKLHKKLISRYGKDQTKAIKISFEYYEAYLLEKYLLRYNAQAEMHTVQTVINLLNQQLA